MCKTGDGNFWRQPSLAFFCFVSFLSARLVYTSHLVGCLYRNRFSLLKKRDAILRYTEGKKTNTRDSNQKSTGNG